MLPSELPGLTDPMVACWMLNPDAPTSDFELERVLGQAEGRFPGVCLSVDDDNAAKRLYLRAGFVLVGHVGKSVTMVKRFGPAPDHQ